MNLIITHAHCPDGWCAAFIAKKRYPEAEIMPLDHGEPVPFGAVRGKDVLVLDFSWPNREDNIELHRIAKSFHIYDHHKTAQERLEGLDFVTFDMKRSGAGLAWDYLFGKDFRDVTTAENAVLAGMTIDELLSAAAYNRFVNMYKFCLYYNEMGRRKKISRPWYVNYVEDRDLWNWALPSSKAVNAYLMSLPQTIEAWSALDILKVEYAEQIGVGILRHVDRYVQEAVAEAQLGDWYTSGAPEFTSCFEYYTVAVVNVPYMNCSEVGHELAKKARVGMTWFERADGQIQFSLRSIGDIDVSRIAKLYGGGGHKNAAGFRMPTPEGRRLIDSILFRDKTNYTGPRC